MDDDATPRLALPLLQAGQAQKEVTHNEALALLDMLVQPAVVAVGIAAPPAAPEPGQAWIVGEDATGAWAGNDHCIAGWTAGGWRFATPVEGLAAWSIADAGPARWHGGVWHVAACGNTVADPSGGTVIDVEARAAVASILAVLRDQALITP